MPDPEAFDLAAFCQHHGITLDFSALDLFAVLRKVSGDGPPRVSFNCSPKDFPPCDTRTRMERLASLMAQADIAAACPSCAGSVYDRVVAIPLGPGGWDYLPVGAWNPPAAPVENP